MDKDETRGYIQVYTGNGKGKTTAAIGLSIRAAGAGLKVYIAQFIKRGDYSEIKALRRYSDWAVSRTGSLCPRILQRLRKVSSRLNPSWLQKNTKSSSWRRPMWPSNMDSSGNRTSSDLW